MKRLMKRLMSETIICVFLVIVVAVCSIRSKDGDARRADDAVGALQKLALAVHNYYDFNNVFPSAYDEDGRTWKESGVLKPYLDDLAGCSGYAMLVDDEGVFPTTPGQKTKNFGEITDGAKVTIMFVERADPNDDRACITADEFYEQLRNCPIDKKGYSVALASGGVGILRKDASRYALMAFTTKAGGV